MKQQTQVKILEKLLERIESGEDADAGRIVQNPSSSYTSNDVAVKEWRALFLGHPQLIGLSADLPTPGSYYVLDNFGIPVLATRDEGGKFRAFLNACRHRGARLTNDCKGTKTRFSCPFHGWTYAANGELLAITESQNFGSLNTENLGLVELPSQEAAGMLWVHPKREGTLNIKEQLGDLFTELAGWRLGERVVSGRNTLSKSMNWKLANDTFGENYHFKRLHRDTLNRMAVGDAHVFEAIGKNSRLVFASKGIDKLRRKPKDQWRIDKATTVLYYLFPNIQMTVSDRQVTLFRIYGDAEKANCSTTEVTHYFSPEALETIDAGDKTVIDERNVYDPNARDGNAIVSPAAAMEVIDSTLEKEDFKMAEMTQQSAASGLLDNVIFGRNEPALHHFHNSIRASLGLAELADYHDI